MFGGILAVWTRIAMENTTQCDDILILDRQLTENDFVEFTKSFEDLADFVRRCSHPQIRVQYELFPNIKRVWSRDGSTSYTLNHIDLSDGSMSRVLPSGGRYDVDLLTHRFKWRTYCCSLGFPKEARYVRAVTREYRYKFCVLCSKAITAKCSRCKKYYCCGSALCKKKAWALHKPVCVST